MNKETAFMYEASKKSAGMPVAIEIIGGLFQVFGLGSIIAGDISGGILLMIAYGLVQCVNFLLMFVGIGFVTAPLTWILFMLIGVMMASKAVEKENAKLYARLKEVERD